MTATTKPKETPHEDNTALRELSLHMAVEIAKLKNTRKAVEDSTDVLADAEKLYAYLTKK